MKIFKNRQAAGELLAVKLRGIQADLILGIPRGGVVVAEKLAEELNLPLDIIVIRKIGAPGQEELALGAVDPDGEVVLDEALLRQFQISNFKNQIRKEWEEVKRRGKLYRQGRRPLEIYGKVVILTDDGMATGSTALAAVKYLNRHGAKVILAMPVASSDALERIKSEVGDSVVLETPEYFQAVGQFYEEFEPVTDEEVMQLLRGWH